jgi:beta-1,2-mannobiose phosphorylase / 1,2-beta-oligomannan phosphorylase
VYPDIQIVYFNDIKDLTNEFWREYLFNIKKFTVLEGKFPFEASYIGGGCPPIETNVGWLIIYHGVEDTLCGYVYHACAALLDINDPTKEIGRLSYPLFSPDLEWEKKGVVSNVVFPTGAIVQDDTLYIYYGAADKYTGMASVSMSELLSELTSKKTQ